MSSVPDPKPRTVADQEIAAFFALPRRLLFLGLGVAVVLLATVLGLCLLLCRLDRAGWCWPLLAGTGLLITAMATRTVAGRGALRSLGVGHDGGARFAPATQIAFWGVLFLFALAWASWSALSGR